MTAKALTAPIANMYLLLRASEQSLIKPALRIQMAIEKKPETYNDRPGDPASDAVHFARVLYRKCGGIQELFTESVEVFIARGIFTLIAVDAAIDVVRTALRSVMESRVDI